MRRAKGTIYVFTFKEGLLSAVAHDLRLRIEQFAVTLDGTTVRAELDLRTLRLDGPVRDGAVLPEEYEDEERAGVEKTAQRDVLHTREHPTARFSGQATPTRAGFAVSGELELAGRKAPLTFEVREEKGSYQAQFDLVPSRWGIAPYKAMLGAIRLKDLVRIEFVLSDA